MNPEVNDHKTEFRDLTDDLKEYINLRIQIIRLNLTEKVSTTLASLIAASAVVLFLTLFMIVGSMALSYWIGDLVKNTTLGFAIVAAFYLVIALVVMGLSRKRIKPSIVNKFITEFSKEEDDVDAV